MLYSVEVPAPTPLDRFYEGTVYIGLVSEVLAPPALMEAAERYADAIIRNGPLGVRSAKESMIRGLGRTLEDAMRLENILFSTLTRTDDFKEGPRAFTEKREPVWKGR